MTIKLGYSVRRWKRNKKRKCQIHISDWSLFLHRSSAYLVIRTSSWAGFLSGCWRAPGSWPQRWSWRTCRNPRGLSATLSGLDGGRCAGPLLGWRFNCSDVVSQCLPITSNLYRWAVLRCIKIFEKTIKVYGYSADNTYWNILEDDSQGSCSAQCRNYVDAYIREVHKAST